MPHQQPSEFPGLLGLVSFVSRLAGTALLRAITHPFHKRTASTYYKDVFFAVVRCSIGTMTIPQARYLLPNSTQTYLKWCKSQKIEPRLVEIPAEGVNREGKVHMHWIGNPDTADVKILYFHGGAYTQYATEGYYHYWTRWMREYNDRYQKVAVLMVAYSVAPEHKYPTQLREVSAALSYLVDDLHVSPSDIIVSGDSAGGHLGLSLLTHLLHPHPEVAEVVIDKPLRGSLLISTWATMRTDFDSFTRNVDSDMVVPSVRRWAAMWLGQSNPKDPEKDPGPIVGDQYSDSLSNDPEWWEGLDSVVSDVFQWRGGDEMLVDPIAELDAKMIEGWVAGGGQKERFVSIETPRHAHIAPIAGVMMDKEKCEAQLAVEEWLKARLRK
ncbi:alpha/beta-hydrolase [Aaosphaeria arxii CBS 175.79]|uniref:Alpha/beta-hydrolase n=1 Tax=Aaosphaeria arxii CBS 175.79 TaxID=1450172 RepID=A0A6A5XML4_9PLEO|nr:alpha/beta-hydrolase [Aaosphaeria arxii CBS 175.79]KAF2014051.1 alpha/beta-hydrolase [Aaosphaeria arxii CBS 175.79]